MFVGEKLTDIRLLHEYTRKELAHMLEVSEQSVWQYENNYNGPKLEIVNQLKMIFNVKTKYFYDATSWKSQINPHLVAYRSKNGYSSAKTRHEAVHLEHIEGLINLFEQDISYPANHLLRIRNYSIRYMINHAESANRISIIKHIAEYAREQLQLGADNQRLLFTLEMNGAFIFEKSLGYDVDAYSIWSEQERPMIMLGNVKKSAVRRNFDLAHELGHLLLHYKVDMSELSSTDYKKIENEAHDFASYFLMPEQEFRKDIQNIQKVSNPKAYIELKEKWLVSIQAMAYYARKLNLMTYDQHRYFYASLKKNEYEPLDKEIKIIKPGKVRSSIQFLLDKKLLSVESLIRRTFYNEVLLSKILGLEESFFKSYMNIVEPQSFAVSDISLKRKLK